MRLREEAERLRSEAEAQNKANQEAILRLLNEMGNLADGDLTVQATVTEDITGAIADSINFTIEELRTLVGRHQQRRGAGDERDRVRAGDLGERCSRPPSGSRRRSRKRGASVLKMAQSINEVSANASKSASVARQSLSAAEKGQEAVQN